jgi:Ca2+-binding EF-hand superfamily protein
MSNTISSVASSGYSASTTQSVGRHNRPDPAKLAETLFSSLDTSGKGYVEIADLQAAMDSTATASGKTSAVSASDVFTSLDSDSDGKVTKQEMTDSIKKLADDLETQFQSSRMSHAMAGMGGPGGAGGMPPPPPPPKDDSGFTKDELSSQLSAADSTDTKRTSLLSDIVKNFDAADTDGDGKVSFQEAMNYQSTSAAAASSATTSSSASTSNTATATSSSSTGGSTEKKVMRQIMQLVAAYVDFGGTASGSAGAGVSVKV